MRDETLIEHFAVPEIFVDGFSDHIITNGVMSCAGYRLQQAPGATKPERVVVVRIVIPAVAVDEAIADARQAQSATIVTIEGMRVARH